MSEMTMQVVSHAPGVPLGLETAAIPEPGPGEVLIKVAAAGLNRPDLLQRAGLYPAPPGAPKTLGLEVAGEIVAIGAGVNRWHIGDEVCALLAGGGYAEYALAPAGSVLQVPVGLSMVEAASLPETVFTVWANVFEAGALAPAERFLVHGGTSGIGVTAIQMARAHGAEVFATAGTPEKCIAVTSLGARAINHRSEDFEEIIRAEGGVDVILDMVGGRYVAKNLAILREGGRCVQIAFLEGARAEVDLTRLMLKRLTLTGSTLRSRALEEKARLAAAVEATVWPWVAAGLVKPVIDQVFPLAEAEAAHARLQSGEHIGKIMLVTGDG